MARQAVIQEGVFTSATKKIINENFIDLYATGAGGALTEGYLLVGSGDDVAAGVAVSGDATLAATGALTVVSVGGVKFAQGIDALDASNPTTIETGLTTVTSFTATLVRTTSLETGTAFVTIGAPTAGAVPVYGWVVAGTASTGTEDFHWTATGT